MCKLFGSKYSRNHFPQSSNIVLVRAPKLDGSCFVVMQCVLLGHRAYRRINLRVNPNKWMQNVLGCILIEFVMLNSILKVYSIMTSGNGLFSKWRPSWLP